VTPINRSRLPVPAAGPAFRFPAVQKRSLATGLRVWTVERRGLPVVTFLLILPSGSGSDPAGRAGLSALTADMLDEGSGDRSALDVQDALARMGAELNTEVGPDATTLTLTTLTRFIEPALVLFADIVAKPALAEADFQRVRELRLNRLAQLRDMPPAVADRVLLREIYRGHPYGHLSIGTEQGLRDASLDDLVGFHRGAYLPQQMVFIAVGDETHERLAGGVESAFGGWLPDQTREKVRLDEPDAVSTAEPPDAPPERRLAVVHRPGAAQSELRIGRLAAARLTPEYHTLLVLNTVLGGQFVSRINMNLRQDKGYTYGARTSFDFRRRRGPFVLQASVHTASTADAIREALGELDAVRGRRPVTPHELDTARAALTQGFPRNFETAEQMARGLAQLALYGLPDDYFDRFVPAVNAVTAGQVTESALAYLDPSAMITAIVGDQEVFGSRLQDLGLGEAVEVPGLD
jgi:zinc protease